ncbi:hypothetical protein [Flavobacterium sp. B183]|uniref:hypothetical protein n=1 Tax=Flavobacterium sp. B183 TaxID=907046 RepID=UPI00201F0B60|nr:hypothetical protein [Flavobacterium sp. B183]URC11437.1 hypothetical protein M4I44_15185 [Flavobacterium sp. B183]
MRKFNLGDVVTVKIQPNNGQMYIEQNLGKIMGGSDDNPMYLCKFYDEKTNSYKNDRFLESVLQLVENKSE